MRRVTRLWANCPRPVTDRRRRLSFAHLEQRVTWRSALVICERILPQGTGSLPIIGSQATDKQGWNALNACRTLRSRKENGEARP
jgi:hypothetical protein